jgi:hypothetical protein
MQKRNIVPEILTRIIHAKAMNNDDNQLKNIDYHLLMSGLTTPAIVS